jgi:hypothetical protein
VPLMLRIVCYAMAGVLTLYYRSLGTASTLLRRGNISGRPCIGVMNYKALDFSALKQIGNPLGNLIHDYGSGKSCYYLTGYALPRITGLSLLCSYSMFLIDEL